MIQIQQRAFTLIELLVAMTIGAFILAASLRLYALSRTLYQTTQNLAELEARAVFAMRQLGADIAHAGYFGLHANGHLLRADSELSLTCSGRDAADWLIDTGQPIAARNAGGTLPCPPRFGTVEGTDTLTLRSAGTFAADRNSPAPFILTGFSGGIITRDHSTALPIATTTREALSVNTWYLGADSSEEMPALYRQSLRSDGRIENQEIMPGIEDFQVRLGIDLDADNLTDAFINPPDDEALPGPIVAVQIQLRLRSRWPEQGHTDPGRWASIDPSATTVQLADRIRRTTVEKTFPVTNPHLLAAVRTTSGEER